MTEPTLIRPEVDWEAFAKALGDVPTNRDPTFVRQRSRDFFWYSPVLNRTLEGKHGDIVALPRDEDEVVRVARACVEWKAPLTVRGAGTGNYGQAVPLAGGVILDVTAMDAIVWLEPGMLRVQAGAKMLDVEEAARKTGWEWRLFPSTVRTATIGGFIAGGSSGIGAVMHGLLRDPGNINGLRVVTLEDEPRVLELRGPEINKVNHAYGTNGIITELEMPLAPAYPWADVIVAFDDFMEGCRFGQALAEADGIVKREVSVYAWPVPEYFRPLHRHLPDGKAVAICMVAEQFLEWFDYVVADFGGETVYRKSAAEVAKLTPVYEYCWNHTTLQALKVDKRVTYLQSLFAPGDHLDRIARMHAHFGDEAPMHVEFVRMGGRIGCFGLQLYRYTSDERLFEAIDYLEQNGVPVFNPHTHVLEDGGMKVVDPDQLAFKRMADPHGLLNPGKMRAWWEQAAVEGRAGALYAAQDTLGWRASQRVEG